MEEKVRFLEGFITPSRKATIDRVLSARTRYVSLVLEDIYQSQNANAVLRTCECLGVQDVHLIENRHSYQYNPDVLKGSDKWLTLRRYQGMPDNTSNALHSLKQQGYRVLVTSPHAGNTVNDIDLRQGKLAVIIGNEASGVSRTAMELADESVQIPMTGFTESFNLSVSAGIIMYSLLQLLRVSDVAWQLSQQELLELRFDWYYKSVRNPSSLMQRFSSL